MGAIRLSYNNRVLWAKIFLDEHYRRYKFEDNFLKRFESRKVEKFNYLLIIFNFFLLTDCLGVRIHRKIFYIVC